MTLRNDALTRAAPLRASTWDAEALTFDITLSAFAPVARSDQRGAYDEVLSPDQSWPESIPLLDGHRSGTLDDNLGDVSNIRIEAHELVGTARLSRHNPRAQRLAAELSDGRTFKASIGYAVTRVIERTNPQTKRRERVAAEFSLLEASIVNVPADKSAGIRSEQPLTTTFTDRAAINAEIRSIARVAKLDQAWIDGQIDANADADAARTAAFAAMTARTSAAEIRTTAHNDTSMDNPDFRRATLAEAIYSRSAPGHSPSEQARAFVHSTAVDIARECLRLANVQTSGLAAGAIVERAFNTTSDFPIILGDSTNRVLRDGYTSVQSALKPLGRQSSAKNFLAKHSIQLSEAPELLKVNEHGEFTTGGMTEAKESYAVETFGRIFAITRQVIINDQLNAFGDVVRKFGQSAAVREAKLIVDLFTQASGVGPTMSDGKAFFHTGHGNLASPAAAISVASLSAARRAMWKQTGLSGELVDIRPNYVVVSPDLATEAEQLLANITPTTQADYNPFAGKLKLIVEPRFTGTRWYVAADPAALVGFEYSYLEGQEGVQTFVDNGFDIDGVRIKARLDFGVGAINWRAWYTNAGA